MKGADRQMELLRIQQIEKYYGSKSSLTKAIDDISFNVEKGEFVAIMGASGSGKTTLLNCISTIDRVTAGHIFLEDTDITALKGKALNRFRREKLGFIFQDFNLLDTLTAYENIALALSIQKRPAKEIDTAVKTVVEQLGITEVLQKYPYQMSGGQKQRVASARAIVTDPRLVLADEPTGALDSKAAKMLLERFRYLNQERGATIMMVTHDSFTASYAGRVIFIKDGKIFHENGGDNHQDDVDVTDAGKEQHGNQDGHDDDDAAHGGDTLLLFTVGVDGGVAHLLIDFLAAHKLDKILAKPRRDDQREDERQQ